MTLSNKQASDLSSLLHPFTNLKLLAETGPVILERGKAVLELGYPTTPLVDGLRLTVDWLRAEGHA